MTMASASCTLASLAMPASLAAHGSSNCSSGRAQGALSWTTQEGHRTMCSHSRRLRQQVRQRQLCASASAKSSSTQGGAWNGDKEISPLIDVSFFKKLHKVADSLGMNKPPGDDSELLVKVCGEQGKRMKEDKKPNAQLDALLKEYFKGQPAEKKAEDHQGLAESLRNMQLYGELAQSTYDTMLTKDTESKRFGEVKKEVGDLKEAFTSWEHHTWQTEEPLGFKHYKNLMSTGGFYNISALKQKENYAGHVLYRHDPATDHLEVVISWRGTVFKQEWIQDAKAFMTSWNLGFPDKTPRQVDENTWKDLGLPFRPLKWGLGIYVAWLLLSWGNFIQPPWGDTGLSSLASGSLSGALEASWGAKAEFAVLLVHLQVWWFLAFGTGALAVEYLVLGLKKVQEGKFENYTPDKLFSYLKEWATFAGALFQKVHARGDAPAVHYGFKQSYGTSEGVRDGLDMCVPREDLLNYIADLADKYKPKKLSLRTTGHSLGGALSAVNCFDLDDLATMPEADFSEALKKTFLSPENPAIERENHRKMAAAMMRYRAVTARARGESRSGPEVVTVTGYTYAAPRTGDINFAQRCTNSKPISVAGPALFATFGGLFIALLFGYVDVFSQLEAVEHIAIITSLVFYSLLLSLPAYFKLGAPKAAAKRKGLLKVFRIFNNRDIVSMIPYGLFSFEGMCHGGRRVELDNYHISVFDHKTGPDAPKSVLPQRYLAQIPFPVILDFPLLTLFLMTDTAMMSPRHNLEGYLKMLVPSRNYVLLNKGGSKLIQEMNIAPAWYDAKDKSPARPGIKPESPPEVKKGRYAY